MADRYWVGGSGNWNDTSHWSTSSGGPGGASVPADGDTVYIDTNSGSGNFTITINTTTANLRACIITYPSSKGILTISQTDASCVFNCYYLPPNPTDADYATGGLISGVSQTNYANVRWVGNSTTPAKLRLLRYELYGSASVAEGFAFTPVGGVEIELYGTNIIWATRNGVIANVFQPIYKTTIKTPKTVFYAHPDGSGTKTKNGNKGEYGCDFSFSVYPPMTQYLVIDTNARLATDMTAHYSGCPAILGFYVQVLNSTCIVLNSGAEWDIGITFEVHNNATSFPNVVFPRFVRIVGHATSHSIDRDIVVQGDYASYIEFIGRYTADTNLTVNMNGNKLKAPKVYLSSYSSATVNDITPANYSAPAVVTNCGGIEANNLYIYGGNSSTAQPYSLTMSTNATIKGYTTDFCNIVLRTGTKGAVLNMSASGTVLWSGTFDASDTSQTGNIDFRVPTAYWYVYGNISIGSKVTISPQFVGNADMVIRSTGTYSNASTNRVFIKSLTVNANYTLGSGNALAIYNPPSAVVTIGNGITLTINSNLQVYFSGISGTRYIYNNGTLAGSSVFEMMARDNSNIDLYGDITMVNGIVSCGYGAGIVKVYGNITARRLLLRYDAGNTRMSYIFYGNISVSEYAYTGWNIPSSGAEIYAEFRGTLTAPYFNINFDNKSNAKTTLKFYGNTTLTSGITYSNDGGSNITLELYAHNSITITTGAFTVKSYATFDFSNLTGTLTTTGAITIQGTFRTPGTGANWNIQGNVTISSGATYTYNGCAINIKNNLTINNSANTSVEAQHFGWLAIDTGRVLTINGRLETINGNFTPNQISLVNTSWLVSKNHMGVVNNFLVVGTLNWTTPQIYPLTSSTSLPNGINLAVSKPASGATLFTFDSDNVGIRALNIEAGTTWRIVDNVDIYLLYLTNNGTLYVGPGYYGQYHLGGVSPFEFNVIDLINELDEEQVDIFGRLD